MKKLFLSALVALSAHTVWADDYNYLTVAYNSVEQSIALGTVQKITFENGNCVVSTTDGQFTYPLSQMEKMRFTADPTAIKSLPSTSKSLAFANGLLTLGRPGTLRIYNAGGSLIRLAEVDKNGTADLRSLPKGLYIISLGDETIKIKK
ncbi:MAG: T9SS type A sorting domain-containing protein [Bacteroidaceae bacterium]|nr:T9SS type A sorting domain-containing protein [Bacteroidaceae bacterium]